MLFRIQVLKSMNLNVYMIYDIIWLVLFFSYISKNSWLYCVKGNIMKYIYIYLYNGNGNIMRKN